MDVTNARTDAAITNVANAQANAQAAASQAQDPGEMGKQEFLELLVAQLGHQDPMNPVDDKAFIAQLAQFSSLEQMVETNRRLELLQVGQGAIANAQIASLIGREIVASGDKLVLSDPERVPAIHFDLADRADSTTVRIYDAENNLVRTIERRGLAAGDQTIEWDGKDDNGKPLAPGTYRVEITAVSSEGDPVAASTRMQGVVTGISFANGYPELLLGDGASVTPADVLDIREANADSASATQEGE